MEQHADVRISSDFLNMSNFRKYLFYTLFFLMASIVFIYVLFPGQKVKEYIQFNLQSKASDLDIAIEEIKLAFPLGIRLNSTDIYQLGQRIFAITHITVTPKVLSFLGGKNRFLFKGDAYEGHFEGDINIGGESPDELIVFDIDFSDIHIDSIPIFEQLSKRKITGLLSGKVVYNRRGMTHKATGTIAIDNGKVDLLTPVFNVNTVLFDSATAEVDLSNERLQVKSLAISGPQADGNFAGQIRIKDPLGDSTINLSGMLKPQSSFLADLTKNIPTYLVPKKLFEGKGAPITLNGTFEKPGFVLR